MLTPEQRNALQAAQAYYDVAHDGTATKTHLGALLAIVDSQQAENSLLLINVVQRMTDDEWLTALESISNDLLGQDNETTPAS